MRRELEELTADYDGLIVRSRAISGNWTKLSISVQSERGPFCRAF
jgi:hypothetical protein